MSKQVQGRGEEANEVWCQKQVLERGRKRVRFGVKKVQGRGEEEAHQG